MFHRVLKRGCSEPEEIFLDHYKRLIESGRGKLHIAEIGVDKGATTREILKLMRSGDRLDLYDRDNCSLFVKGIENIPEGVQVNFYSCSNKRKDSYAWTLAEGIELDSDGAIKPKYDLVFLDGAHVFDVDAPATAYLKELLKVGGIIIFSDMNFSL